MSSQLNMNDLFETSNHKTLRRLETFDSILKKCHSRIKYYSKLEQTCCFYLIPEFIIGTPLYDVLELRKYMINSLKKNGFEVQYIDPNYLIINWEKKKKDVKDLQKNTQSTIKQIKSDYKPIEEYKPTGKFVYDQASMMSIADKSKQILNIGTLNI
mgnify:FL=1